MSAHDLHRRMLARLPKGGHRWYEIRNQHEDKAVVRIYEEIGVLGITAEDFVHDLEAIAASEIEVQINSPGGEVFAGIAIYNALRTHSARITTRVDGIAASAASVIAQAGDRRIMVESAQLMIHEAWGVAVGPADELREFADLLEKQNGVLATIYAARSPKTPAHFRELMKTDTYLTDEESVDLGLADEVFVPEGQRARNTRTGDIAASVARRMTADKVASVAAQKLDASRKPAPDAAAIARGIAGALKRDDR